jgi:ABC-2 type transport system ATP-binding protein
LSSADGREPPRETITASTTRAEELFELDETSAVRIVGLSKTFNGGVTAVADLSLTVARGQVFGLLGPNGSGKTTTLRMLLGLVHPTSGTAYVFGHRITPGHPVLHRVGVLVERPAFVPHLSGRRNLELFWRAGGQRREEADFERSLEIAGLGAAIDRKTATYSKGMLQRLGLAQAMLNRPGLLVLDEPTVGLDPQQLREVRELIREVAGEGTTVILSSHVLAEVEQVCSRVAVMNRGRLVALGSISDLTRESSSIYVEVDDLERAGRVLEKLEGVLAVTRELSGFSMRLKGLEREALVTALVQQGIGVRAIVWRHRLEDAFLEALSEVPQ